MLVAGVSEPLIIVAVITLVLLATFIGGRTSRRREDTSSTQHTNSTNTSNSTSSSR
jgi:hypothetical protein